MHSGPTAHRFLRRRLAFAVARRCQGASTARVPRPDIMARVERCNAAAFSMTMRLYSAGVHVSWAIIKVRRTIVSHDASIISVIIKGSARLRRLVDLRMVPEKITRSGRYRWRSAGRCQGKSIQSGLLALPILVSGCLPDGRGRSAVVRGGARPPTGLAPNPASRPEIPKVGGDPHRIDLRVEIVDLPGTRCSASSSPTVGGKRKGQRCGAPNARRC